MAEQLGEAFSVPVPGLVGEAKSQGGCLQAWAVLPLPARCCFHYRYVVLDNVLEAPPAELHNTLHMLAVYVPPASLASLPRRTVDLARLRPLRQLKVLKLVDNFSDESHTLYVKGFDCLPAGITKLAIKCRDVAPSLELSERFAVSFQPAAYQVVLQRL